MKLKTTYFGLQCLCGNLRDAHLNVLNDNTTVVHPVSNMGSCKSLSCDLEVKKIWSWNNMSNNFETAAHVPNIMNVEEDILSFIIFIIIIVIIIIIIIIIIISIVFSITSEGIL